jgi:glyoxylate reductase
MDEVLEGCLSKPRVFVTRIIADVGLDLIRDFCNVDLWIDELPPSQNEIKARIHGLDGLLCLLTDQINDEVLDSAGPSLKVISNHAVGFDNIDISSATKRRIPVGNTPGILTETTADFSFALLLAGARRVVEGQKAVIAGDWKTWSPLWLLGNDIHGATIGIVGFGRIGQAVARRAAGFGMRILYYDPSPPSSWQSFGVSAEAVELESLLRVSDFVTIHTPLNDQTFHMFGEWAFTSMKSSAILINTARGPIIDQQALFNALKNGAIAFAAIDVTTPEPLPLDSPLLKLNNLIVTPHIASASYATRSKMAEMAAKNLIAGIRGEKLPYCVNPQVYSSL